MASTIKDKVQSILGRSADAPKEPAADELKNTREQYDAAGQGHVFAFWDQLSSAQKGALYAQLSGFDPAHISALAKKALAPAAAAAAPSEAGLDALPASVSASTLDSPAADLKAWHDHGLELVARNRVGVVLMAGGQGTRLGSAAPKGCYDIGLPSRKSLFRLQAERILRVQRLGAKAGGVAEAVVPWYVMTSGPTRGPTEEYFAENDYFGLKKENVVIFEQGVLPCISNDGKILLESKSKVCPSTLLSVETDRSRSPSRRTATAGSTRRSSRPASWRTWSGAACSTCTPTASTTASCASRTRPSSASRRPRAPTSPPRRCASATPRRPSA
jgi:UDP-N-acetylglucosamine/UDP-N-acetylgalactosamine diphosphorylase